MVGDRACIVAATRPKVFEEVFNDPSQDLKELQDALHWFPLCTDFTYTLENVSKSPIYDGPGGRQDQEIESDYKLKKLYEQRGLRWPPLAGEEDEHT